MVAKLFSVKKDACFMAKLFTTYIRPLVEHASVVWSLVEVGQHTQLERVQRHYTRRLFDFYTAPANDERLQNIWLAIIERKKRS